MNTIFERPTLNRTTDRENIALIDRWIADTVDKLNNGFETEVSGDVPTKLSQLEDDSTHRTVTDAEKNTWNNKPSSANVYLTSDAEATTITDTDYVPYSGTAGKKRLAWSYIKSVLKTYFDTVYATISHTHTKSQITDFAHTHTKTDITDFTHTHTKTDITDFAHTHTKSDITDFSHTHTKSQITDLFSVVNNLTSTSTTDALSAKQGSVLDGLSFHTVWRVQVTCSKGATVRIPASGTNSIIKNDYYHLVIPVCEKVARGESSQGVPSKYKSIRTYDGYCEIVVANALDSHSIGVAVLDLGSGSYA